VYKTRTTNLDLSTRDEHGNGEDWDPIGAMDSHENENKISHGMGMGMKCMRMGIKMWKWKKHCILQLESTCSSACVSVLCVPASSADSDRVSSTAGRLLEKRRTN